MNIKKQAYDEIIAHLRKQISLIDENLADNKHRLENLVSAQTILKRKRTEITRLINQVGKGGSKNEA